MKKYKNIIVLVVLAALAIGYYYYLANRPGKTAQDRPIEVTKIEQALDKTVESACKTPREAVKSYSEIIQCLYNEEPSKEDITNLGKKARELFDEELLANNPENDYFGDLTKELDEYKASKKIVVSFAVEKSQDIKKYTQDSKEYALVNASYTVRDPEVFTKVNEEYILRKDDNGYWKILGWRVSAKPVSAEEE